MRHIPLLAVAAAVLLAQACAAPRPIARGIPVTSASQGFPLPDGREDPAERTARLRGRVRFARSGGVLLHRPHRLAQRGRAGQVGLRALLRAHDVPRDAELPDGQVQRRHQGDGRRLQRLHLRRHDRVPHPGRRLRPAHHRRPSRPTASRTCTTRRRSSRKRPAPSSANTTRAPPIPCNPWSRRSTTTPSRPTPTSTPPSAFCATSSTCRTSSPTRASSSTATTGPTT